MELLQWWNLIFILPFLGGIFYLVFMVAFGSSVLEQEVEVDLEGEVDISAHFIAEAYRKAGSLDTEKFIDALEGLKIDSPSGRVEMRACDHQAILPMYFGVTKLSPELGAAMSTDIYTLRGAEVMPSCKEVMEARGQ